MKTITEINLKKTFINTADIHDAGGDEKQYFLEWPYSVISHLQTLTSLSHPTTMTTMTTAKTATTVTTATPTA